MTITKEQVRADFLRKLKALIAEYDVHDEKRNIVWHAELEASDHYQGYSECGEDIRMTFTAHAIWDENGDPIREFCEIDLGRYVTSEEN